MPDMQRKAGISSIVAGLAMALPAFVLRAAPMSDTVTHAPYGKTPAGVAVEIYTLHNSQGMEAKIMSYGGIIVSLTAPDRKGHYAVVVRVWGARAGGRGGAAGGGARGGRGGGRGA